MISSFKHHLGKVARVLSKQPDVILCLISVGEDKCSKTTYIEERSHTIWRFPYHGIESALLIVVIGEVWQF
jgi:hypothetical protein